MEQVDPLILHSLEGSWTKSGDMDTTGGPLQVKGEGEALRDNPKWCHNPQFHVEVSDPYGKEEIFLKMVLRRTDKQAGAKPQAPTGPAGVAAEAKSDVTVGMLICKADILEDNSAMRKKNQPRQNALGEVCA